MEIIKKIFTCFLSVLCLLTLVSMNTQQVKAEDEFCTIEFDSDSDGFTIACANEYLFGEDPDSKDPENPDMINVIDANTRYSIIFSNDEISADIVPTLSEDNGKTIIKVPNDWTLYSGKYIPADTYNMYIQFIYKTYGRKSIKLKNNDNYDIYYKGFNKPCPDSLSISLNENNDLVVACDLSQGCKDYLQTIYDTQNNIKDVPTQGSPVFNNGIYNSNISDSIEGAGGPPLMIPNQCPVPSASSEQYHMFEFTEDGYLIVSNEKIAKYTPTKDNANYNNIKLHVIGYNDYYLSGSLAFKFNKKVVDNSLNLSITFDLATNNFIVKSSSKEYLNSLTGYTFIQKDSDKQVIFNVGASVSLGEDGLYYLVYRDNGFGQLGRLDNGNITVDITLSSSDYYDYTFYNVAFNNPYQIVETLRIDPVASGFRIYASNPSFIDMIANKDENFMLNISKETGRPLNNYRITLDKFDVSKVNDNEAIIIASKEELETLENSGTSPTENKINLNDGYYFQIYHPLFAINNVNGANYALKAIELGSMINNPDNLVLDITDLKTLDDLVKGLTNISVFENLYNSSGSVIGVSGVTSGTLANNYEEGNGDSDLNQVDVNITVYTNIEDIPEEEADKIAEKVDGETVGAAFDVSISRSCVDRNNNSNDGLNPENVNELAYDAIIEFEVADDIELADDEELVVVREHTNNDQSVSYDVLEVSVNEDGVGSVASDKFSTFVLVKRKKVVDAPANNPIINNSTNTYDDGGPFTSDVCGNIYDRWGNKLYSAPSCVLNDGYVVPNTGVK